MAAVPQPSPLARFAPGSLRSLAVLARANGIAVGNATGFVVIHGGEPYLVTNWHVVTGRNPETGQALSETSAVPDELAVLHHLAHTPGSWEYRRQALYGEDGDPLWLEHPTHGQRVDVIAVPLGPDTDGVNLFAYDPARPGPSIIYGSSNAVSIIGFPFGRTAGGGLGIWVQGTIATEPSIDYQDEEHGGVPLPCLPVPFRVLLDSRTRMGQSGSPVIVYRTDGYITEAGSMINNGVPAERFIGVYSGRINSESDLGFVWKARALSEILDGGRQGRLPTLGAVPRASSRSAL